ncbi:hypothetical protein NJ76_14355 [Rhodococcus sp. IITR03]|nr:hypothetical protein NJ76_14355 [Rhodococcus sp. IITR03]
MRLRAHDERARAHHLEALLLVEAPGAGVLLVDAEPQAGTPERVGPRDDRIHERRRDSGTVMARHHVQLADLDRRPRRDHRVDRRILRSGVHCHQVSDDLLTRARLENDAFGRGQVLGELLRAEGALDEVGDVVLGGVRRAGEREGRGGDLSDRLGIPDARLVDGDRFFEWWHGHAHQ